MISFKLNKSCQKKVEVFYSLVLKQLWILISWQYLFCILLMIRRSGLLWSKIVLDFHFMKINSYDESPVCLSRHKILNAYSTVNLVFPISYWFYGYCMCELHYDFFPQYNLFYTCVHKVSILISWFGFFLVFFPL